MVLSPKCRLYICCIFALENKFIYMTGMEFLFFYERDINRLIAELTAYEQDEDIWTTDGDIKNSAGHLSQHLIGNLNTYIGQAIGKIPYKRNRDAEFGQRQFERHQLVELLKDTLSRIRQTLSPLGEKDLDNQFPAEVLFLAEKQTIAFVLTHLLAHFSWHMGQINYHRRLAKTSER